MKSPQAERFRPILEAKLRDIDQFLREQQPPENMAEPGDAIDCSQAAAALDLTLKSADLESDVYRRVRAALDRVDDGTFGLCIRCEREIEPNRLEAVPWAAHCLSCQELLEKDQAPPSTL